MAASSSSSSPPIWEESIPNEDDIPLSLYASHHHHHHQQGHQHGHQAGSSASSLSSSSQQQQVRRSNTIGASGSRLSRINSGSKPSSSSSPASTGVSRRTSLKASPSLRRVMESSVGSGGEEEQQQSLSSLSIENNNDDAGGVDYDDDEEDQALYQGPSSITISGASLARHSSMPISQSRLSSLAGGRRRSSNSGGDGGGPILSPPSSSSTGECYYYPNPAPELIPSLNSNSSSTATSTEQKRLSIIMSGQTSPQSPSYVPPPSSVFSPPPNAPSSPLNSGFVVTSRPTPISPPPSSNNNNTISHRNSVGYPGAQSFVSSGGTGHGRSLSTSHGWSSASSADQLTRSGSGSKSGGQAHSSNSPAHSRHASETIFTSSTTSSSGSPSVGSFLPGQLGRVPSNASSAAAGGSGAGGGTDTRSSTHSGSNHNSSPSPASPIDSSLLGQNNPWSPTAEERMHFRELSANLNLAGIRPQQSSSSSSQSITANEIGTAGRDFSSPSPPIGGGVGISTTSSESALRRAQSLNTHSTLGSGRSRREESGEMGGGVRSGKLSYSASVRHAPSSSSYHHHQQQQQQQQASQESQPQSQQIQTQTQQAPQLPQQPQRRNTPALAPLVTSSDALYTAAKEKDNESNSPMQQTFLATAAAALPSYKDALPISHSQSQQQQQQQHVHQTSAQQNAQPHSHAATHAHAPPPHPNNTALASSTSGAIGLPPSHAQQGLQRALSGAKIIRGPASAAPYVPPIGHTHIPNRSDRSPENVLGATASGSTHSDSRGQFAASGGSNTPNQNQNQYQYQQQHSAYMPQGSAPQQAAFYRGITTAGPGIPESSYLREKERIAGITDVSLQGRSAAGGQHQHHYHHSATPFSTSMPSSVASPGGGGGTASAMQFPSLQDFSTAAAFSNNLQLQQQLLAQQTQHLQEQQAQLAAAMAAGLSLSDSPMAPPATSNHASPNPSLGMAGAFNPYGQNAASLANGAAPSDPYTIAAKIEALQKANAMLAAAMHGPPSQQAFAIGHSPHQSISLSQSQGPSPFGTGLSQPFIPGVQQPGGFGFDTSRGNGVVANDHRRAPTGASPIDMQALTAAKGYNPREFDTRPAQARFFVIKSFTEDDVFKSIKFEIWSSTVLGNNRLDKAFSESAEKGPIYLFFSVNASGHFCGVAEMLTGLDYTVTSNVWAQNDKWKGVMKLRWIYIKDIPNPALRHLKLTNTNEQKPVTSSRDTQEVPYEQGCEILRIFTSYQSKTSLLQDFPYYQAQTGEPQPQQDDTAPPSFKNPDSVQQNAYPYAQQALFNQAAHPNGTPFNRTGTPNLQRGRPNVSLRR